MNVRLILLSHVSFLCPVSQSLVQYIFTSGFFPKTLSVHGVDLYLRHAGDAAVSLLVEYASSRERLSLMDHDVRILPINTVRIGELLAYSFCSTSTVKSSSPFTFPKKFLRSPRDVVSTSEANETWDVLR